MRRGLFPEEVERYVAVDERPHGFEPLLAVYNRVVVGHAALLQRLGELVQVDLGYVEVI